MWLKAAIGIDLGGRVWQNLLRDHRVCGSFEHAEEEADVADGIVDFRVGGQHHQDGTVG